MGSRNKHYTTTRTWVCKLVTRSFALCGSVASIAILVVAEQFFVFYILSAVVSIWSLIDLILLSVRCIPQLVVAAVFDMISAFILLGSATFVLATFEPDEYTVSGEYWIWEVIIGAVLIITAILYFVLFALSVRDHRAAKIEPGYTKTWRPESAWRPESSTFGSETDSIIGMQYGVVNKSTAPSTVGSYAGHHF